MLVTPLRDGMNLVAKEYVACRSDLGGALVLSEFTGAAAELRQAYLVNPHDLEGVKDTIEAALNQPVEEGRRRMRSLRRQVLAHDVDRWARSFLDALAEAHPHEDQVVAAAETHGVARRIAVILDDSVKGAQRENLRRVLAAGAGICCGVALGIALESGHPARAVGPPPDGNYTFNEAGVSGVTWTITALCDQAIRNPQLERLFRPGSSSGRL